MGCLRVPRWFLRWSVGLVFSVAFLLPLGHAWALTLGAMDVRSHLGETFDAVVVVVLADAEVKIGIDASKAVASEYGPLNLEYQDVVAGLQLKMEGKGNERQLLVTSKSPVNAPFFNFLLRVSAGQGDHFRNYPVFLEARPSSLSRDFRPAVDGPKVALATGSAGNSGGYGPVRPGETLSGIAEKFVTQPYSRYQVMAAFFELNKSLFKNGNMNGLVTGVILKVPSEEQIAAMGTVRSREIELAQHQGWVEGGGDATRPPVIPKSVEPAVKLPVIPKSVESGKTSEGMPGGAPVKPPEGGGKLAAVVPVPGGGVGGVKAEAQAGEGGNTPTGGGGDAGVGTAIAAVAKGDSVRLQGEPRGAGPVYSSAQENSSVQVGMAEVEKLKGDVVALSEQLKQSESARTGLQTKLAALEGRFKKWEQENKQGASSGVDVPLELLALGGGIVVLVVGIWAWFGLRGKKRVLLDHGDLPPHSFSGEDAAPSKIVSRSVGVRPVGGETVGPSSGEKDDAGLPSGGRVGVVPVERSRDDRDAGERERRGGDGRALAGVAGAVAVTAAVVGGAVALGGRYGEGGGDVGSGVKAGDDADSDIVDLEDGDGGSIFNLGGEEGSDAPGVFGPSGVVRQGADGLADLGAEDEGSSGPLDLGGGVKKSTAMFGGEDVSDLGVGAGGRDTGDASGEGASLSLGGDDVGGGADSEVLETVAFALPTESVAGAASLAVVGAPEVETLSFDLGDVDALPNRGSSDREEKGSFGGRLELESADEEPDLEIITDGES